MRIHPTALVDGEADLGAGVEIGPYAVIAGRVRLGAACEVGAHAVLQGPLEMGSDNKVFAHAVLGLPPQDLKYRGEETGLSIGQGNSFREFVSVHRGTVQGRGLTSIGSKNLFMAYSHVAHDVVIGDGCVLSNGVMLAGHVEIGNLAIIGGLTGVHQFVRVGRHAFVGGCSAIERDVVPYGLAAGNRARLRHYNAIGLTRAGFGAEALERIREVFRLLLEPSLSTAQALAILEEAKDSPESQEVATFIRASQRGILKGGGKGRRAR